MFVLFRDKRYSLLFSVIKSVPHNVPSSLTPYGSLDVRQKRCGHPQLKYVRILEGKGWIQLLIILPFDLFVGFRFVSSHSYFLHPTSERHSAFPPSLSFRSPAKLWSDDNPTAFSARVWAQKLQKNLVERRTLSTLF